MVRTQMRNSEDGDGRTTLMTHSDERNRPMTPAMKPYIVLIAVPVIVSGQEKGFNIRENVVQRDIDMVSDGGNAEIARNGRVE
jgi:hypothetical protein